MERARGLRPNLLRLTEGLLLMGLQKKDAGIPWDDGGKKAEYVRIHWIVIGTRFLISRIECYYAQLKKTEKVRLGDGTWA